MRVPRCRGLQIGRRSGRAGDPSIEGLDDLAATDLVGVRLVSYPLSVLAVVGASYMLSQRVGPHAYQAAPIVRTQGAPPLSFAPVDRTRRASFRPASTGAPSTSRPGLYALPSGHAASAAAVSAGTGSAIAFSQDPWSVLATAPPASQPSAPVAAAPPAAPAETPTVPTEPTTTAPPAPPAPPVQITDVRQLAMSSTGATISWHTSEPVASRIAYGVDAPALWTAPTAPSVDHVATLPGLTFGTSYVLSVDTQAPDGRTSSSAFVLNTPALADGVTTGTGDGAFRVDGQPFFPTIVWDACSDSYPTQLAAGIDLFMGFVLGPILRRADISVRREVMRQLTPRTLFLMPTVSIVAGTTGWFLAVQLGYTALGWPEYGWVAAALLLVTLMTVLGLGFLTPVNVFVCLELQKANADLARISAWMQWYFYAVAVQGTMQIAIIVVMTRFRTGI